MTTTHGRYEAHSVPGDPGRIVLVDKVGDNSHVTYFPPEFGDAVIERAQTFLDAGIERYGSLDEFDRACRWLLDVGAIA